MPGLKSFDLQSRTGIEEIESYQDERATVMRAIRGYVLALHYSHVGEEEVLIGVAACGGAGVVSESCAATEIRYRAGLMIDRFTKEPREERMDERRKHDAARDWNRLSISRWALHKHRIDDPSGMAVV
jgi:hypothetical protein